MKITINNEKVDWALVASIPESASTQLVVILAYHFVFAYYSFSFVLLAYELIFELNDYVLMRHQITIL